MKRNEEIQKASMIIANGQVSSKHFIQGAIWADEHPKEGLWDAEKVIDWLNSWFTDDICNCRLPITKDARNTFFNDLRKAMEEIQ